MEVAVVEMALNADILQAPHLICHDQLARNVALIFNKDFCCLRYLFLAVFGRFDYCL